MHKDPQKSTVGTIHHKGDLPYETPTILALFHEKPISKREVYAKTHSATDAIAHYIPIDIYRKYLEFFLHSLCRDSNIGILENSIQEARDAFEFKKPRPRNHAYSDTTTTASDFRHKMMVSDLSLDSIDSAELTLSILILHESHGKYIDQLQSSITQSTCLNQDEQHNALYVVEKSFEQFKGFMVFNTLLPLIFMQYRKLTSQENEDRLSIPIDHTFMRQAITKGGGSFFWKENFKNNSRGQQPGKKFFTNLPCALSFSKSSERKLPGRHI